MLGEYEPQSFGHVVVRFEHYVMVFGGAWLVDVENLASRRLLSPNVIWMYNLYTERWRKHTIPGKEKAPHAIRSARAVVIDLVVYVFGGNLEAAGRKSLTNRLWKLTRISDGRFVWDDIVPTDNMKVPSPRSCHTVWNYLGNLWVFGGFGLSQVGYLNDHGNFTDDANNQLFCFNPSYNEWTNPKCLGSIPAPRGNHAAAIIRHTVWVYGGGNNTDVFNELCELNMHSLTWTQIQMPQPKPQGLDCCSLNVISDNQLVLHGGADTYGNYHSSSDTWMLDLSTLTWRLYKSTKDHSRDSHTGTTGLNGCAIIIGGGKDPSESYDDYRTTFCVWLHPKSLQQLAIQCVFQHKDELPWKYLPKRLKTLLGISQTE